MILKRAKKNAFRGTKIDEIECTIYFGKMGAIFGTLIDLLSDLEIKSGEEACLFTWT